MYDKMRIYQIRVGSVDGVGHTLQGSFPAGWLAGKPDYPQKLKVPEGYEKMIDYSNI